MRDSTSANRKSARPGEAARREYCRRTAIGSRSGAASMARSIGLRSGPMLAMNVTSRVSPGGGLAWRLRRAAAGMLDAWLPASCIVCDRPRSDRLCDDCEAALPGVRAARCPRCGLALPVAGDAAPARCAGCDDDPPAFAATVVLADYAAPLVRLVHALKFGRDASLARPLGRALAQRLAFDWPDGPPPLVTAIPLSVARLAERGFNQS